MANNTLTFCELESAKKLEFAFSRLKQAGYCIESPKTRSHNCIAYAAGKEDKWWWPDSVNYWPIKQREETLACFITAYESEGFEVCSDGELEQGFEKIAIYVDVDGITPLHAAKQLLSGKWKSKCGNWEDIEHNTVEAVGGNRQHIYGSEYGTVGKFMKRSRLQEGDS